MNGAVAIKKRIIGPAHSDIGTEGDVESLSTVNDNQLAGLGIVNGNEFVIYTTITRSSYTFSLVRFLFLMVIQERSKCGEKAYLTLLR